MSLNSELYEAYALRETPSSWHCDNHFFRYLLASLKFFGRIPAIGMNPGLSIDIHSMPGVANLSSSLALECAQVQMGNISSCGYAMEEETDYLRYSPALCRSYFLWTAVNYVVKPSGVVDLYTCNASFLDALSGKRLPRIDCLAERFLFNHMQDQIKTGELMSIRIDPVTHKPFPGKVEASDTVIPAFLVPVYIAQLLERLQGCKAMLLYEECPGKIKQYPVTLWDVLLRGRCSLRTEDYLRAAWDGKSPEVVLPVCSNLTPDCITLKKFSIFKILEMQFLPNL